MDFGDGSIGRGKKIISHTYVNSGTYTIKLTVRDNDGRSDSSKQTIVITGPREATTTFPVNLTGKDLPEAIMVTLNVEKGFGEVMGLPNVDSLDYPDAPVSWTVYEDAGGLYDEWLGNIQPW